MRSKNKEEDEPNDVKNIDTVVKKLKKLFEL